MPLIARRSTGLVTIVPVADGTVVVFRCQALHARNAGELAGVLLDLTPALGWGNLYLDFGAVEFLSSLVLGQLILLDRELRKAGDRLILGNLAPPLLELLQACRLTEFLSIRAIPHAPGKSG